MKKIMALMAIVMMLVSGTPALAGDYTDLLGKRIKEGGSDIYSGLTAVPESFMESRQAEGTRGVKELLGVANGLVQTIGDTGQGLWKMVTAFIPGMQDV